MISADTIWKQFGDLAVEKPNPDAGILMQRGEVFLELVKACEIKGFEFKKRDDYRDDLIHEKDIIELYTDFELIMHKLYVKNRSKYSIEVKHLKELLALKDRLMAKPFMCHCKMHLVTEEDNFKIKDEFFMTIFPDKPGVKEAMEEGFQYAIDCMSEKKHFNLWITPVVWEFYKKKMEEATGIKWAYSDLRYSKFEINDKKGFFQSAKDRNAPIKNAVIELVKGKAIMPPGY